MCVADPTGSATLEGAGSMQAAQKGSFGFGKSILNNRKYQGWFWGYLMIFPTVLGLGLFYAWPLLQSFYLAFTKWGAFGNYSWCGTANFARLLHDTNLLQALKNTFIFTLYD